jgi:hypothetical protein
MRRSWDALTGCPYGIVTYDQRNCVLVAQHPARMRAKGQALKGENASPINALLFGQAHACVIQVWPNEGGGFQSVPKVGVPACMGTRFPYSLCRLCARWPNYDQSFLTAASAWSVTASVFHRRLLYSIPRPSLYWQRNSNISAWHRVKSDGDASLCSENAFGAWTRSGR